MTGDRDDELIARFDAWCRNQDDVDDSLAECLAERRFHDRQARGLAYALLASI